MGDNRDLVLQQCRPAMELGFSLAEYDQRLAAIRTRMAADNIDLLWLMAPESLYYVSGYSCEWYQAQSPKQWPATSGIAIHVDHDRFILFDTPSEQVMSRFVTCSRDTRIFPIDNRRDGIGFIIDELQAEGWLRGTVGMELHSYRPNPAISARFRAAFEAAGTNVTDGSDILRELRWIKSPQEIAYLEHAARSFYVGDPPRDVLDYHARSSGVFEVIAGILKPGLTVGELVRAARAYYDQAGIWSDAGWVGGYELGIGFPPDWVGNFVYEMSDADSTRVFEPRTCVNFESQFFSPRLSGITYYICTLLFKEHGAELPVQAPRELVVID